MDQDIYNKFARFINPTYPSFLGKFGINHVAASASGATIKDSAGKTYIDCVAGYGLFNLGHYNPRIVEAMIDQLGRQQLFSRPLITEISVELAQALANLCPGELECSFLCNSGSEAIDSAIKLSRLHTGRTKIIAAENSFHGYTYGALSASGIPAFKRYFQPVVPEIIHVPYGDAEAIERNADEKTAAVILEPMQHEAGVSLPPGDYFGRVKDLCRRCGALLVMDEIKTGMGKTGRMFAFEHFGTVPDVIVLGKSLGGGLVPIGALVASRAIWKKFGWSFPMSASSYAWNVLACRVALETIKILSETEIIRCCEEQGEYLLGELQSVAEQFSALLKVVNGKGLLIGISTNGPVAALTLARHMISNGVLVFPAFGNSSVLMVEPPMTIERQQCRQVAEALYNACKFLEKGE